MLFCFYSLNKHPIQHILNENSVACGGGVDQHVVWPYSASLRCKFATQTLRADELAVLDNRASAHECGQEGTTKFNRDLTVESINRLKLKQQVPFLKSFP